MSTHPQFAHSQSRLQARYAALPAETDWQRLAGARTFSAFIEDARTGPLQSWVKGLSALSGEHELERGLRNLAADLVEETARWVPGQWREAVQWVAWLPFLPVFEHLSRGGSLPPWAALDYRLGALLDPGGVLQVDSLRQQGLPTLIAAGEPERVAPLWVEAWRQRWPAVDSQSRRHLESFSARIGSHLAAFRLATPQTAWGLRRELRERMRLAFHQRLLEPVTVYIYLALVLLDLERLRAELLRRLLFPRDLVGEGSA